jgi:hypothetical protein
VVTGCCPGWVGTQRLWSSWWWVVCCSKHVEPSINFEIINSITRLHLVGYIYWFIQLDLSPDKVLNVADRSYWLSTIIYTVSEKIVPFSLQETFWCEYGRKWTIA